MCAAVTVEGVRCETRRELLHALRLQPQDLAPWQDALLNVEDIDTCLCSVDVEQTCKLRGYTVTPDEDFDWVASKGTD